MFKYSKTTPFAVVGVAMFCIVAGLTFFPVVAGQAHFAWLAAHAVVLCVTGGACAVAAPAPWRRFAQRCFAKTSPDASLPLP